MTGYLFQQRRHWRYSRMSIRGAYGENLGGTWAAKAVKTNVDRISLGREGPRAPLGHTMIHRRRNKGWRLILVTHETLCLDKFADMKTLKRHIIDAKDQVRTITPNRSLKPPKKNPTTSTS